MPTRTRHAYFDRDTVCPISQERFERITDLHTREPVPHLAGRRIRFITLFVEFDDDVAVEVTLVEPAWVTFDAEGRRDEADAAQARRATVGLLDEDLPSSGSPTVVPAAARFQCAGFRWEPTARQLDTVLFAHGLHKEQGTPFDPCSNRSDFDLQPHPAEPERRHLRLLPVHRPCRRPPITSAELSASLTKQWASWHPDSLSHDDYPWLAWDDADKAVRNLAWLAIDKLYDDLTAQGLATGEIITYAMFPATIGGHLP